MSDELPEGWVEATLGDVITGFEAGRNLRANGGPASPGEYGVLKISAVTWGSFKPEENKGLLPGDVPKPHERIRKGDLLITRANTSDLVGAVVLVERDHPELMLPDKILRLLPRYGGVESRYLLQALHTQAVRDHFERNATGTSDSMRNLSQPKMAAAPISVAPIPEQRRIVEAVEALLEQVNGAKGRIDRVPLILKRFRRAVLAAACSGRLTERWSRVDRLPRRDVDLGELPDLPEFPEEWGCGPLDAFTVRFQYGTSEKADADEATGVPVLRMGNIQDGALDLGDLKYIKRSRELDAFLVKPGDVLFNRTNSPELVGKTAVVTTTRPMTFASYIVRAQLNEQWLRPEFASWWLNSGWGRAWARHVRTDGVSQSNINATKLAAMPIPLPSLTEQDEVIRRGTKLLALADAIERRVQAASARADRLPQAILSKAFSGELVPTEADLARAEGRAYETAEELLARVGREVENGAGNATGSHRPTREVGQKHGRRAAR